MTFYLVSFDVSKDKIIKESKQNKKERISNEIRKDLHQALGGIEVNESCIITHNSIIFDSNYQGPDPIEAIKQKISRLKPEQKEFMDQISIVAAEIKIDETCFFHNEYFTKEDFAPYDLLRATDSIDTNLSTLADMSASDDIITKNWQSGLM